MAPAAPSDAQAAPSGDVYLDNVSNQSLEILQHFGPEAPAKLNLYATKVEDALMQALGHQKNQAGIIAKQQEYISRVQNVLKAASTERKAMMKVLSDPTELSTYVNGFFGPDGPHPVQTPGEQARAALQQGMIQPTGPLMAAGAGQSQGQPQGQPTAEQQGFRRPQMPMPTPGAQQGNVSPQSVWNSFSRAMDVDPTKAWMLLDQASPDALRSKVLMVEG